MKVQVKQGQGDFGNFNPSELGPHVRIFGKHRLGGSYGSLTGTPIVKEGDLGIPNP